MTTPPPQPPDELPTWFEEFYRREVTALARVVMRAGGTLQEAEDAAHEIFAKMLHRVRHGEEIRYPRAYARKAVLNYFTGIRSRHKRGHELAVKSALPETWQDLRLEEWEGRQWVDQLLTHCPPAQRKVMECVLEGLSHHEIADLLGKTPATVRKNYQLGRQCLEPFVRHACQVVAQIDSRSDISPISQEDAR
ncbi:RNA polymerase sigma factor [Acrocarpospora sp. B8E8]|uniref:RNA polymerase sigma factor n=1 Tax=Acrocarpospora sp. B8E8 TaxID=3153572 RepID=UPI00325CA64B